MLMLKKLCVWQNACILRGTAAFARQVTETAAATDQIDERTRFNRADSEAYTGERLKQLLVKVESSVLGPEELRTLEEKSRSRLLQLASVHQLHLSDSAKEALMSWKRGD